MVNVEKNVARRVQGITLAEAVLKKSKLKEIESRRWVNEYVDEGSDDLMDVLPWIMDDDFEYQKKQLEERIYEYMEYGT